MKLIEFSFVVGAVAPEWPACRDVLYVVAFEDSVGQVKKHSVASFVYDGLLDDPDQIPWLIAQMLRNLMIPPKAIN